MEKNSILELRGVSKHFGSCKANDEINITIEKGSVHAIVGENGAGKSTLLKIIYGQYRPTAGKILVHGVNTHWRSPKDAIDHGIGMVHQHFMLAGSHSVLDNILLGLDKFPFALIQREEARKKLNDLLARFELEVDLDERVENLSVGIQQRVEIIKLLFRDANVLILDEPTAVLTSGEVEKFFTLIRELKKLGKTILIVTHKLREVFALADRVSVLRAGKIVEHREIAHTNMEELSELMVGKVLVKPQWNQRESHQASTLVKVSLQKKGKLQGAELAVRQGEIVGICGVEGNGQSEFIRALLFPEDRKIYVGAQDFARELFIGKAELAPLPKFIHDQFY